jgi:hypothetical protein
MLRKEEKNFFKKNLIYFSIILFKFIPNLLTFLI